MNSVCFVHLSAYGYFDESVQAYGGAQRQLSLIARELTDEFSVHFVVGNYGQPQREEVDGVTLHRAYDVRDSSSVIEKPLQFSRLFRAMQRADADLYISRSNIQKMGFVALFASLLGSEYVFNVGNDPNLQGQPEQLSLLRRYLFRRGLQNAAEVIAQTEKQAEILRRDYGIDPAIVPNGYPPVAETKAHEERSYFLWVGGIEEDQKRPHLYLDIAEACPDCEFKLVGPGGHDERYTERIRQRAAGIPNVTDVGAVPPSEVDAYYRDAIALVNTSLYEGFPNTYLESWRHATPVLGLAVDPGRFVEPDVNGYAAGDVESLVSMVERLDKDPSRRPELGTPARKYTESELSMERVAEQYAATLKRVLDN